MTPITQEVIGKAPLAAEAHYALLTAYIDAGFEREEAVKLVGDWVQGFLISRNQS